jgi:hypothetical protein
MWRPGSYPDRRARIGGPGTDVACGEAFVYRAEGVVDVAHGLGDDLGIVVMPGSSRGAGSLASRRAGPAGAGSLPQQPLVVAMPSAGLMSAPPS